MSFLAGRLAGAEGAYFLQESKQAVTRIVQKNKPKLPSSSTSRLPIENEAQADVLPEVLRHSLPSNIFQSPPDSSLSTASKWVLQSDPSNPSYAMRDALNPLSAYVSLPQVTFGPKRWQIPNSDNSVLASTANELRRDKYIPVNPEKLKAATAGLSQIAKAFVVATALVFGSASMIFGVTISKLEIHTGDDMKAKGRDLIQPKLEMLKERLTPLKNWAGDMSNKCHLEREENMKEKILLKELSKILGAKTPN